MVDPAAYIALTGAELGYAKAGKNISVLQELHLQFYSGELVGIVGLNGIGKSTLLKTISGLLPLLKGEIRIGGRPLAALSPAQLAVKVAVVLTEKIGGFNLSVFDVVASGQMPYTDAFHRLNEKHMKVIEAAMEQSGIAAYRHQLMSELSDGLFQKTIIAKALAQQTPAILLDEPTAFLDYASKHSLFLLLKELVRKEHKCILVSSHDLDLLVKYCDRLLIISDQKAELIRTGEALTNPAFMKVGGGFI